MYRRERKKKKRKRPHLRRGGDTKRERGRKEGEGGEWTNQPFSPRRERGGESSCLVLVIIHRFDSHKNHFGKKKRADIRKKRFGRKYYEITFIDRQSSSHKKKSHREFSFPETGHSFLEEIEKKIFFGENEERNHAKKEPVKKILPHITKSKLKLTTTFALKNGSPNFILSSLKSGGKVPFYFQNNRLNHPKTLVHRAPKSDSCKEEEKNARREQQHFFASVPFP